MTSGAVTPQAPLSAWLDRLALALLTESSGGFIYANDGGAYAEGMHPELPDATRERVYAVLRVSLSIPHDRVGHDGRSTGPLQQISYEASRALYPNLTGGWAPMASTMDPGESAVAFIRRLTVTNNSTYSQGLDSVVLSSPIAADVLRTQQPSIASARSANYSAAQVALAQRVARGGSRFFTDRSV